MVSYVSEQDIDLEEWAVMTECADKLRTPSGMTDDVMERFHNEGAGSFGTPLPWKKAQGRWDLRPGEMTIWAGVNGHGKATSLDTPIPTPDGWTTMGEIEVGDTVFDDQGKQCRVVGATEVMEGRPCYRIEFSGGTEIVCDEQHEWFVYTAKCRQSLRNAKNRPERNGDPKNDQTHKRTFPDVRTTGRIAQGVKVSSGCWEGLNQYSVHVAGALETEARNLPVSPYLLGLWLGDGSSNGAQITTADEEVVGCFEAYGYEVRKLKAKYLYSIGSGFIKELRSADVVDNKHVPSEYLRASPLQRSWLLQGLMDADGHVTNYGRCEFTNTNKALAEAVLELVHSLGCQARLLEERATLEGRDCGPKYRVTFTPEFDAFHLERKRQHLKDSISERAKHRFIVSCERVDSVPVRCIEVDSPSHLYLCTKAMIPTHNSLVTGQVALDLAAQGEKVCMASFEMRPVQTLYRMTRQALGNEVPTKERVADFHHSTDFRLWMLDHMGTMHWRKVVGLGRYFGQAHDPFNVQHLFVDSLVKLGIAPGDLDKQCEAVNELFAMAKDTGVHVHLIHHVSKEDESKQLHKGRVKGAGEITDQVDNVCLVWRNKYKERELEKLNGDPDARKQYDVHLDVCKQRDGEWEGKLGLYYHAHSMQFVEEVGPPIDYLSRFKRVEAA